MEVTGKELANGIPEFRTRSVITFYRFFRTRLQKHTYSRQSQFFNSFYFRIIYDIMINKDERVEVRLLFFHSRQTQERVSSVCVSALQPGRNRRRHLMFHPAMHLVHIPFSQWLCLIRYRYNLQNKTLHSNLTCSVQK